MMMVWTEILARMAKSALVAFIPAFFLGILFFRRTKRKGKG